VTHGTRARLLAILAWAPSAALLAGGVALIPLNASTGAEDAGGSLLVAVFAFGFGSVLEASSARLRREIDLGERQLFAVKAEETVELANVRLWPRAPKAGR
jgi:hypothetical protein